MPQLEALTLDFDDEVYSADRQTVLPEFDLEAYAREQMHAPDNDGRIHAPSDLAATRPPPVGIPSLLNNSVSSDPDRSKIRRISSAISIPNAQALADMRAYLDERDYSSALVIAESLLDEDRGNKEAKACVQTCQAALQEVYLRRLGSLNQVPVLVLSLCELRDAALDHRSGFLLSLMDGVSTFEMILDVSGMPQLEALRVVLGLVQQGVITVA